MCFEKTLKYHVLGQCGDGWTVLHKEYNEAKTKRDTVEKVEFNADDVYDWSTGLDQADDSKFKFEGKLGSSESALRKTLLDDYYINFKLKKILMGASVKAKKPLFVQLVLDNIWAVYEAVQGKQKEKLEKIVTSLSLKTKGHNLFHSLS